MLRDLTEQSTLLLLISEVIELEGNADILLAQETDHRLQIIPFLPITRTFSTWIAACTFSF